MDTLQTDHDAVISLGTDTATVHLGGGSREFRNTTKQTARAAAEEFLAQVAAKDGPLKVQIQEGLDTAKWQLISIAPPAAEADATSQEQKPATPSLSDRLSKLRSQDGGGASALTARLTDARGALATTDRRVLLIVGSVALVVLLLAWMLIRGGGDDSADAAASPPDACYGGRDPVAAALAARNLATESTIQQDGVTAPSPRGAMEAAMAYARLRSTLPIPSGRDNAMQQILAPGVTKAARTLVTQQQLVKSKATGLRIHLDMSQARALLVSGDGTTADIDAVIKQAGTDARGTVLDLKPRAVHMSLTVVDGQWRLKDVRNPQTSLDQLTAATTFTNTQECSQ